MSSKHVVSRSAGDMGESFRAVWGDVNLTVVKKYRVMSHIIFL
jgi:hypothetical protein